MADNSTAECGNPTAGHNDHHDDAATFPGADALLHELARSEFPVSDDVIERLRGICDHLVNVSPDDPEFERYLREDVIEHGTFTRAEAIDISDSVLDVSARHKNDPALLVPFFVAFEWFHRCEFDADQRMLYWRRFVPLLRPCLGGFSLYQYALSMFCLYGGDEQGAEAASRRALDTAPDHIGFLNTYTEQILDRVEHELISSGRQMPDEDDRQSLERLLDDFEKRPRDGWHPIFHVSYGRILACLGRYGEAQSEFSQAVDLENARYNEWSDSHDASNGGTIKGSTYVTEMNEIFDARNTCNMLSNMRSLSSVIDDAQDAQRARARELDDKMDELGRRFDNERIDMLEFIGFFAGIISFVIASIQLGDGLSFPTRALMVLIVMGSLLVAFGAFSMLLESGRAVGPKDAKQGRMFGVRTGLIAVIAIGLVVIVTAMLMYLVIR